MARCELCGEPMSRTEPGDWCWTCEGRYHSEADTHYDDEIEREYEAEMNRLWELECAMYFSRTFHRLYRNGKRRRTLRSIMT